MAERFLGWKLPDTVNPDGGIRFEPISNKGLPHEYRHVPVGTNLFDYTQATEMVRHMVEGLPPATEMGIEPLVELLTELKTAKRKLPEALKPTLTHRSITFMEWPEVGR